jgi:hypothetical protein
MEWFELNKENGEVHIVGQINDFDGTLQFSPTKRKFHPAVQNLPTLTLSTPPIDLDPFRDPTQHSLASLQMSLPRKTRRCTGKSQMMTKMTLNPLLH